MNKSWPSKEELSCCLLWPGFLSLSAFVLYTLQSHVIIIITLSAKNEQWKWIELPEIDNIWIEDWLLRFLTWTLRKIGMPKGCSLKSNSSGSNLMGLPKTSILDGDFDDVDDLSLSYSSVKTFSLLRVLSLIKNESCFISFVSIICAFFFFVNWPRFRSPTLKTECNYKIYCTYVQNAFFFGLPTIWIRRIITVCITHDTLLYYAAYPCVLETSSLRACKEQKEDKINSLQEKQFFAFHSHLKLFLLLDR